MSARRQGEERGAVFERTYYYFIHLKSMGKWLRANILDGPATHSSKLSSHSGSGPIRGSSLRAGVVLNTSQVHQTFLPKLNILGKGGICNNQNSFLMLSPSNPCVFIGMF